MKLWILRPIADWKPWYDKAFGFVVRAESEGEARHTASEGHGHEGAEVWLDEKKTNCVELTSDGEPGLVIRDFCSS